MATIKEDIARKDEIGNKEECGNNQGNKQASAKKKEEKSAEIEAAQLRAKQFFERLENPVSTGDKPPAVSDEDEIICVEQTQQTNKQ